jgi:cell division initiation protein
MITPLDIENKKFSKKAINGYNPEEVDDFLDEVIKDYESLFRQSSDNKNKIEELNSKLEHYNKIESTLQNTLVMAQSAADEVKRAAEKQAEQIIKEAENKARESTMGIEQQITDRKKELENVQKQFDVYKAKMESLLISQLELLKEINKDDNI